MKTSLLALLTSLITLCLGCNKPPNTEPSHPQNAAPTAQAPRFQRQAYRSLDGKAMLTLISRDEAELREDGRTLLCKYTKEADGFRVVATVLGTAQVAYYRATDGSLKSEDGVILLSQERYVAAMEQIKRKQQEELDQRQNAKRETIRIDTFQLHSHQFPSAASADQVILTDVSLMLHCPPVNIGPAQDTRDFVVYFADVYSVDDKLTPWSDERFGFALNFRIQNATLRDVYIPRTEWIICNTEADAQRIQRMILTTFGAWKAKFPLAVARN